MSYNVRERVSLYQYGLASEGYSYNVIGVFLLDILRPDDVELIEIISYPSATIITECLCSIFTRMGEIEGLDFGEQIFLLSKQGRWDEAINMLQRIVNDHTYINEGEKDDL